MMQGKSAIVTGGSTGIGYAVAARLADAGAVVTLAGRDRARGDAAASTLAARGGRVRFVTTDVRDEDSVRRLVGDTIAASGGVDVFFNNAGIEGALAPLAGYPVESLDELL